MGAAGMRTHIWNNGLKSLGLLACFPILLGLLAYGGILAAAAAQGMPFDRAFPYAMRKLPDLLPWILGISGVWFVIAWFINTWMIGHSTGARSVTRREEPRFYNITETLCISQGMPLPKLAVMETDALNAFAMGMNRSQYTVAVTRGLLETLDDDELEAVIAHELSHIQHGDVRLLVITTIFVGIIAFVTDMLFNNWDVLLRGSLFSGSSDDDDKKGSFLASLAIVLVAVVIFIVVRLLGVLCKLAISRRREFMADMQAVRMTRKPDAMIGALRRISGRSEVPGIPADVRPMFFDDAPGFLGAVLSTHPTIESRIAAIARHTGTASRRPAGAAPRIARGR